MPSNRALARRELGVSATGWSPQRELSFGEWRQVGERFARIGEASRWWLADWLNWGAEHHPDRYAEALEVTGYDYGTLRNLAYVAGRFPLSRRHDKLSFSAHVEVAALEPAEADALLDRAEAEGWSVMRLRGEARRVRGRDAQAQLAAQAEAAKANATSAGASVAAQAQLAEAGVVATTGAPVPLSPTKALTFTLAFPPADPTEAKDRLNGKLERLRERAAQLGLRVVEA